MIEASEDHSSFFSADPWESASVQSVDQNLISTLFMHPVAALRAHTVLNRLYENGRTAFEHEHKQKS